MPPDKFKYWTRRILAIFIILPLIGVLVVLSLRGNAEALTSLISIAGIVLGFYFGSKVAETKP